MPDRCGHRWQAPLVSGSRRHGDVEALSHVAAKRRENLKLLLGFYVLSNRFQSQCLDDSQDRSKGLAGCFFAVDIGDEEAV